MLIEEWLSLCNHISDSSLKIDTLIIALIGSPLSAGHGQSPGRQQMEWKTWQRKTPILLY